MILRAALGAALVVFAVLCFSDRNSYSALVVSGLALLTGTFLIAGFLTPVAAALAGVGTLALKLSWLPQPSSPTIFESPLVILFAVAVAIALILLGPGAYSIDSRLFGRREIIIPQRPKS